MKDAVAAVKRAICSKIEDLVSAADIFFGPGTRLEKISVMPQKIYCLFIAVAILVKLNRFQTVHRFDRDMGEPTQYSLRESIL